MLFSLPKMYILALDLHSHWDGCTPRYHWNGSRQLIDMQIPIWPGAARKIAVEARDHNDNIRSLLPLDQAHLCGY
jgi:hypothetical protein